jgi:lauroyl/myristoyl acyltransferase
LIVFRIIAALPRFVLPSLAGIIAVLAFIFAKKDSKIVKQNVQRVYNLPVGSDFSASFVRQVFRAQAFLFLETIRYVFRPNEVRIDGIEDAKKILENTSEQSGVIIIAAHHGAWELAGHVAAKCLGRDFHALAKPSRSQWLTGALNKIRAILGMNVLWTDSKTLLRDMMEISNKKEHLGFVMDQRPAKRASGFPCIFLGVPDTHIVQGPAMMAAKKQMPVFGVHSVRVGFCHYQFYVTEVLGANHGISDQGKIAQLMADDLSKMILRYPEQWAWNYRRWK